MIKDSIQLRSNHPVSSPTTRLPRLPVSTVITTVEGGTRRMGMDPLVSSSRIHALSLSHYPGADALRAC